MSLSALQSWKPARCSAESGISPLSHVSVKHKTADEGKSLLFPNSSFNFSSLLSSERTLERNIPGKGVRNPRWLARLGVGSRATMTTELRRFRVRGKQWLLLLASGYLSTRLWPRLFMTIFFEKRTKNGTEVFPRKEICIRSFD